MCQQKKRPLTKNNQMKTSPFAISKEIFSRKRSEKAAEKVLIVT